MSHQPIEPYYPRKRGFHSKSPMINFLYHSGKALLITWGLAGWFVIAVYIATSGAPGHAF